jgi:hypothetical protein
MSALPKDSLREILIALLQHDVNGKALRLIVAALMDAGPVSKTDWAARAGLPQAHFARTLAEAERLKIIEARAEADGLKLFVRPPAFWRVTPLVTDAAQASAWVKPQAQARLSISTEAPDLTDALALTKMVSAHQNGESARAANTRSVLIEKIRSNDRDGDGISRLGRENERAYLLQKLKLMPRVQQEIMRPQNDDQRRMGRLFWKAEEKDVEWLKGIIGDLSTRTDVANKAAWLNKSLTTRFEASASQRPGRAIPASTAAIDIGVGPSHDQTYG